MARIKKRFCIFTFLLILSSALAAETPVQDFFFELTLQSLGGPSILPFDEALLEVTRPLARIYTMPVWRRYRPYPLCLFEYICPEKLGAFDSTFSLSDLFTAEGQNEGPASDWVDTALLTVRMNSLSERQPEQFDVAEQMLSQMDNRDEGGILEGQDEKSDQPSERSFTDSKGRIRRFSYGVEQLAVREKDGFRILVDSAAGLTIRRFYDEHNRMVKQERFKLGSSSLSLNLLSTRTYSYDGDSVLPYQMTEDISSGSKHNVTRYDDQGLIVSLLEAHYEKEESKDREPEEPEPEARLVRDKSNSWTYDEEKRITEEEGTTYFYSKTSTGRQRVEEYHVRRVYDYTGAGKKPDYTYYENGEVRVHTVYESENVYNETMYFDDGFTVLARYENNTKRLEIVSVNGREVRRRVF